MLNQKQIPDKQKLTNLPRTNTDYQVFEVFFYLERK